MIRVIDLFAGPGGLGEGFFNVTKNGNKAFYISLSIEKDRYAIQTLRLRSFLRKLPLRGQKALYSYYANPQKEELCKIILKYPTQWAAAVNETINLELSPLNRLKVRKLIRRAIKKSKRWVLVGGPPCQAYSLVGRARRTNEPRNNFDEDKRHTLYVEYLDILQKLKPSAFIMENVKGILSAKHKGAQIFKKICKDLAGTGYKLYSLSSSSERESFQNKNFGSFVVKAEKYGIPQARHRVFILGIRKDIKNIPSKLKEENLRPVDRALQGLPFVRSRLSVMDTFNKWLRIRNEGLLKAGEKMQNSAVDFVGSEFVKTKDIKRRSWKSAFLTGVPNHEGRSHCEGDIKRYAFLAALASKKKKTLKVTEFPEELKPDHKNITFKKVPFADRFKVQIFGKPSSTITAHLAKDSHYYIHPDFRQARGLTVREAARIQTFPDNYRFEGPKTEQYRQVGNAVPPLLATKIAKIVLGVLQDG